MSLATKGDSHMPKFHIVRRFQDIASDGMPWVYKLAFEGLVTDERTARALADEVNRANCNRPAWLGTYFTVPAPYAGECGF
jgi:hypothetical protein